MRDTKPTVHSGIWLLRPFLLLTLGVTLAACESEIQYRPLATIHMPNVTPIPGVTTVEQQHHAYSLDSIATYETTGDRPTAHLLLLASQAAYDTTFGGGSPTTSILAKNCTSRLRVSRDGAWLACDTYGGIEVAALGDNVSGTNSLTVSTSYQIEYIGNAAWAPDGRRIAAFHITNNDCSIVIYSTEPPYTTSDEVMSLEFPEFFESIGDSQLICPVEDLTWSPDGAWLAFSAGLQGGGSPMVYALPLASLPRPTEPSGGVVRAIPVSLSMLTTIGAGDGLAWPANSTKLTYVDAPGTSIKQFDMLSGSTSTLLGLLPERVCNLSWTPSGRQLVFVLCRDEIPESPTPAAQPYVYTPNL